MASQDLPNGFTGFAQRKPGFVSASDAMRKTVAPAGGASRPQAAVDADASALGGAPRGSFQYARDRAREGAPDADAGTASSLAFDLDAIDAQSDLERRWAWVEIDLGAIRHNVMEARRRLPRACRLLAVVKADAYGHGAEQTAKMALNSGADYLGVATVVEGMRLRRAGVTAPVLILSQPPATSIPALLAYNIMPAVYDPEFAIRYAETADTHGMRAPFHLAVNTGMNRIGVRFDEVAAFMMQVGFHRALDLEGTFTHFATADGADTFDFEMQARRFVEAMTSLRQMGVSPGIVHAANTAAFIRYPEVHFDMVRLGIGMYGYHPCPETQRLIDLRPAMSVHARITDTRLVPTSEGVSYGLNYRSPGSVKICTIPIGYADGLVRALSGRIDFVLEGRLFRQVGNICMDQCMFEADMRSYGTRKRIDPQVGDEVLVVGRQGDAVTSIDDMAAKLGTISYELCIGFSHRMPKIYR